MNTERIADLVRQLLVEIGEDPDREGLLKTPDRVARAYEFLTSGYREDLDAIIPITRSRIPLGHCFGDRQ